MILHTFILRGRSNYSLVDKGGGQDQLLAGEVVFDIRASEKKMHLSSMVQFFKTSKVINSSAGSVLQELGSNPGLMDVTFR